MALAHVEERRVDGRAAVERDRAAGVEAAARRDAGRVGRLAGEDLRLAASGGSGGTTDSRARGVRVLGIGQDVARRADLHDPAEVHDRDPIGVGGHRRQVVGDHHDRDPLVAGQARAAG